MIARSIYRLMLIGFLHFLSYPVLAQVNESGFRINGDAVQLDSACYQLTRDSLFQVGSMWNENQINLNEPFQIVVDMFLGCIDDNGADGLAFVLQPVSTTLGISGEGLGFLGIEPSFGIEFDTWQNFNLSDPEYDHIAIIEDGLLDHATVNNLAGPVQMSNDSPNTEDCQWHNIKISWDPLVQIIQVFFDCELRLSYEGNIIQEIFSGNPDVFWGFTAATGGAINVQSVCFVYSTILDSLPEVALCRGDTFQVDLPEVLNYEWSPDIGISSISSSNPLISPLDSQVYIVQISDDCDIIGSDELIVNVNEVDFTIDSIETNCNLLDIALTASNGFPGYEYRLNDMPAQSAPFYADLPTGETLRFYVEDDAGCSDSIYLYLEPVEPPIIDRIIIQNPGCNNDGTIRLFASIDAQLSGLLGELGDTSFSYNDLADGTYQFWVEGFQGCHDTSDVVTLSKDTISIENIEIVNPDCNQQNGSISVSASGGIGEIQFALDDSQFTTLNTFMIGQGSYNINVMDSSGCSITLPVEVSTDCGLYIPNVFSPNGDQVNDVWQIHGASNQIDRIEFLGIYDRFGNLVYQIQDQPFLNNIEWDGKNNQGQFFIPQVFTFALKYSDITGSIKYKSGDITLLR